jgi:steroid delta-isomerase-like uncharacterized protein
MKNLIYVFVIAAIITSCKMPDKDAGKQTTAMKERVQQFYDQVINAHNPGAIDSFVTADFVDHNPDPGHSGKGIDDLKASFSDFFKGFPDIHATTNFMVAEDNKVVAHITMAGTNSGPMGNMPATNKQMSIDGIDIIQIKDGKATDRWGLFNTMKMMTDLGMMPAHSATPDSTNKMKMQKK